MADRYLRFGCRIGLMPETEIESIHFFPVKAVTNTVEPDFNAFIKRANASSKIQTLKYNCEERKLYDFTLSLFII